MQLAAKPKIYHIVHVDRLASIVAEGCLWCDAEAQRRSSPGTTIGMSDIKQRRRTNRLNSRPGLHVGDCVPFYFCPRSVMLYVIHKANHPELAYRGGQGPIMHLEADLPQTIDRADRCERRWAFTLSNAGSSYFNDRCGVAQLQEIDWKAVAARSWIDCREEKQAEFLIERSFPWTLVGRIGVCSRSTLGQVNESVQTAHHSPAVQLMPEWYN